MDINVNGVNITLTKEQLAEIARQTEKKATINDINSYEDACKILSRTPNYTLQFINRKYFIQHILETIIEAANFIDNDYKKWKADFTDTNIFKYLPRFERISSGWVLAGVFVHCYYADAGSGFGFYYMKESTAKLIANKFIKEYNIYLD